MENQKILDKLEEKNLSIKDLKLKEIVPNSIDGVIIFIMDEELQVHIPSDMTGEKYKHWKKGRGGVFVKDIKACIKNDNCPHYVLLSGDGKTVIARLIEDTEIEGFNNLKIIDGKIKDMPYMKLRSVNENERLTKTDRYIEEKDEEMVPEPILVIPNNNISSNEDTADQGNVSLFND